MNIRSDRIVAKHEQLQSAKGRAWMRCRSPSWLGRQLDRYCSLATEDEGATDRLDHQQSHPNGNFSIARM
jgi:hypothetical protein